MQRLDIVVRPSRARAFFGKPLAPPSPNRLPVADAIRFICAGWVMWIHIPQSAALQDTTSFARCRLTYFVILSTLFLLTSQKAHPRRFRDYALARFRILYLPFLAWTAIYFVFNGLSNQFISGQVWPRLTLGTPFNGATPHLWFLPYILMAGVATFPLASWLLDHVRHPRWVIGGALLMGLATATISTPIFHAVMDGRVGHHGARDFVYRSITLTPCVFIGLAVYFLFQLARKQSIKVRQGLAIAGLCLFACCIGYNCLMPTNPVLESVTGMGLVLVAFWPASNAFVLWLGTLGRFSYGMYLVHMLFVDSFKMLRQNVIHMPPVWWYDVATLLLCVVLSLCASMLLSRSPLTRWLIAAPTPAAPARIPVAA